MKVRYISFKEVAAIHEDMIDQYGGSHGIRDLGLVESALARPQAPFSKIDLYKTIFDKAAALFHSMMFNYAFVDGNKRTTFAIAVRFLYKNGYSLEISQEEVVNFPLSVENEHLSVEEIAAWLEDNSKKT